jgi:pilus assembly protein Flp/PilA
MNAMLAVYCYVKSFFSAEEGQDLIEYALIAALIAVVAVVAITAVGTNVNTLWTSLQAEVANAAP